MYDAPYSDQPSSSPTRVVTGITPLETSAYTDDPGEDDNNEEYHPDATYIEDQDGGTTAVMRNDLRSSSCHPMNKYICLTVVVFAALALGAGLSVQNNEEAENSSSTRNREPPQPSPTLWPGTTSTTTTTTVSTTTTTATSSAPKTFAFLPLVALVLPPVRNSSTIPEYIDPAVSFGHIVGINNEGNQYAVATKRDPTGPASNYGSFDLFRIDMGGTLLYEQLVYEIAPDPLPSVALQYQSLSMHGGRVAFTQGRKVGVYYQSQTGEYVPLGPDIQDFGPSPNDPSYDSSVSYFAVHVALAPGGFLLGVLVSNDKLKPGRLEIYEDNQDHSGDTWERVSVIELSAPISGGTLEFDLLRKILAVGWFVEDGPGPVTEKFNLFYSPDFKSNEWTPIPTANDDSIPGSIVSVSIDGTGLAIGSLGGKSNTVVLLRFNEDTKSWTPFGTNYVLQGENLAANFGASVELGFDNVQQVKRLFVGAPGNGPSMKGQLFVYEYDLASNLWVPLGSPLTSGIPGDMFGSSIAIDSAAENLIVGMPERSNLSQTTTGAFAIYELREVL